VNHLELLEEPRVGEVVRAIHERLDKFFQGADGGEAASRARALDPPARAAAPEMRGLPSLLTAATGDDAAG
jgi:hypothetical protein